MAMAGMGQFAGGQANNTEPGHIARAPFAEEFGTWCDKQRMSMSALAAKIGVTRQAIRLWRTGGAFPRDPQCDKLYVITKLDCFGPQRNAARPVRRSTKGVRGKWKNPKRREQMLGVACPQFQKHTDAQILRAFLLEDKSPEQIGDNLGYRPSSSKIEGREVRKQGSIRKRLKRIFGTTGLETRKQLIHGDPMSCAWFSRFRKNFGEPPNKRLAECLNVGEHHVWNLQRSSGLLTPQFCDKARQCEREFIDILMRDRGRRANHFKAVVPDLADKLRIAAEAIARLRDLTEETLELDRKPKDVAVLFVAHDYGVKVWVAQQAAYLSRVSATASGEIRALLFPVAPSTRMPKPPGTRKKTFSERLIEKGRFCDRIIEEARKIKRLCVDGGKTIAEVWTQYPEFAIWRVRDELGEEDRATFNHPRQWGPVVGYAKMLLGKQQGKSESTINEWIKAYRKSLKTPALGV